jgi:hypothetical protein
LAKLFSGLASLRCGGVGEEEGFLDENCTADTITIIRNHEELLNLRSLEM